MSYLVRYCGKCCWWFIQWHSSVYESGLNKCHCTALVGRTIQGHKLEIFASCSCWKITGFPALFQFQYGFPELASSCGGIQQRVSTVPFVRHHSLVAVGPRTAVVAVAMGTTVGSHTSWLCVKLYSLNWWCSTDCMCLTAGNPGREHPSFLLLASQGCFPYNSLAGNIKKSVWRFGCVGVWVQTQSWDRG